MRKRKVKLEPLLQELKSQRPLRFRDMTPSCIPDKTAGVYLISVRGKSYYVGRTKRLRGRLYNDHLMGDPRKARLKKYLISSGECKDKQAAKDFLRKHALVRWLEVKDL